MIDLRTKIGKIVDKSRFVIECIVCGKKIVVHSISDIPKRCTCSHEKTYVIRDNMSVITK